MALFGITLKKLEAIPSDISHMFGGGSSPAPRSTPTGGGAAPGTNAPWQSPAQQAANAVHAPAVAQPQAYNPMLTPPPSVAPPNQKKTDALHNPVTDFLGSNVVKPTIAPVVQFGKEAIAVPQAIGREIHNKPITDIQQKTFGTTDPGRIAEKIVGSTAGTALTVGTLGLGSGAEAGAEGAVNAASKGAQALSKLKGPAIGAGFGASGEMANGGNLKQVALGTGAGAGIGTAGVMAAHAYKSLGHDVLDKISNFTGEMHTNPFLNEEGSVRAGQTSAAAPKPKTYNIVPKADSSLKINGPVPQKTADASHILSALYNEAPDRVEVGNGLLKDAAARGHQLINIAIGRARRFSVAGDQLDEAIAHDYTPEEIQAARDYKEGVGPKPTARVKALADITNQLDEHGYNVLDRVSTAKEPMHRVAKYATRVVNTAANPNAVVGNTTHQVMNSIQDIFNAKSGFGASRVVQKFVNPKTGEARFGTQTELGLTKKGDNLVDSNGAKWQPRATSTSELNDNGFDYKDLNEATNQYHSSVGRVKAAQDAKAELLGDPEHYGLMKGAPASDPLGRYTPVKGIPELNGYYAPRQIARDIADTFDHPYVPSVGERAFQGVSTGAIQSIVYNALFHTRNLNELAGLAAGKIKGLAGGALYKKALFDTLRMSDAEKAGIEDRMNQEGVVRETYGADHQTMISDALDKVGMPHINKASPALMGSIDWGMRRALFHLATTGEGAVSDQEAAALVNKFMGDRMNSSVLSRNFGLFWHYMKTRVGVVADAIRHPNENQGTILMAAEQAAVLYGATKAFQEWTGNKHASLGSPGIFGLITKGKEIVHGQGAAAATSSINPVVTAAANQAFGKDLYTGDKVGNGPLAPGQQRQSRLENLEHTIIAPTTNTSKVADGKATVGQEALQMGLGVSVPHVRGAPAIPKANNPLDVINAKGAKPTPDEKNPQGKVVVHDPTGLDQATLFYKARDKALRAVQDNPLGTDAIGAYLDDNVNAKGQKVKKDPSQAVGVAKLLAGTPDALAAMKKMQQAEPSHDPMWDLSEADIKTFLHYNSNPSDQQQASKIIDANFNKGQGLTNFVKVRDAYFNNNPHPPGSALDNPETPQYPSFQGDQEAQYELYKQQYQNADGKAKSAFIQSHPLVADALKQLSDYYNKDAVAKGYLATKDSAQLTPEQQTWYTWYNSLPKGTGARSTAIKNNKAMWASISDILSQSNLVNLAKEGGVDQYQGVPFSQKFLKDAYNAGKYDIAKGSDGSYAVAPAAASSGSGGGSSSSSSAKARSTVSKLIASEKASSQRRDAEHAAKAGNNLIKGVKRNAKLRGPQRLSIHMRGETKVKPFRVKGATLKPRQVAKKPAKPARALQRSNRATLKT